MLTVLGGDANVRPYFITKILDMLIAEGGKSRTPMLLRRSALHVWDALKSSIIQSATNVSVKQFKEYIAVQKEYLPNLIISMKRRSFTYEDEDGNEVNAESPRQSKKKGVTTSKSLKIVLEKRNKRTVVVDRHTLRRLLMFMKETFAVLEPCTDDDEKHTATTLIMELQNALSEAAADIFVSSLVDVSYHAAAMSGNGAENNVVFEHKSFANQLKVSCDALSGILDCYWAALGLLPPRSAEEAEKNFLVRPVLTWCVEKMKEAAPPKGMLRLMLCAVKGLESESSVMFKECPVTRKPEDEVSPLDIYRANNLWLAQTAHVEALELHDALCPIVGKHLMAKDIVDVIAALGNQAEAEGFDDRADISVGILSSVVALTAPARPELTKQSLRDLIDPKLEKQRIVNGFPKSAASGRFGGPLTRKIRFNATNTDSDPMSASLYIHIVMSSCFDFFESLNSPAKRRRGATYMGLQLDAFIEHAALLVRCLKDCAKHQKHREYIGATLGDILATCLGMQNHRDGRVRLAGFEIFASSLDVLFLAEESASLAQQSDSLVSDTAGLGTMQVRSISSLTAATANAANAEGAGSVKELTPTSAKLERKSSSNQNGKESSARPDKKSGGKTGAADAKAATKEEQDEKLQEIYINGGAYVFHSDSQSSSDLSFEEKGWEMLCSFMTESLGIGKYADFVVRRACLEYLRQCILKALQGSASGASVISFAHVEQIWDAVLRLVDSPVQSLNSLAFWVICATINVGLYSAVLAKGKGASKQRAAELEEFVFSRLFVTAENYIKSGNKESRLWGVRLLEVYFRARSMNSHSLEVCPVPPKKILIALNNLKKDWCEECRALAKSLFDMHYDIPLKKQSTPSSSFSDKAQSFMSMKRLGYQDDSESANQTIELWFPALPQPTSVAKMEKFGRTLESFANTEIAGGEETDLSDDEEDDEYADEDYDEGDEEELDYEDEADQQSLYVEDTVQSVDVAVDQSSKPVEIKEDLSQAEQEFTSNHVKPVAPPVVKPVVKPPVKPVVKHAVKPVVPEKQEVPKPSVMVEKVAEKKTESPDSDEDDHDDWGGTSIPDEVELVGEEYLIQDIDDSPKSRKTSDAKSGSFVPADMDEKMPSRPFRRTGSFIGRPTKAISAEGEAPKLEKRRSVDSVMLGSKSFKRLVETSADRKRGDDRIDDAPPSSGSYRRLAHREAIAKGRIDEQDSSSPKESGGPSSNRSMPSTKSQKDLINSGFLPIRGSRVKRGVNLDDEMDEPGREVTVRPSAIASGGTDDWRLKTESPIRSGAVSRGRRSLPRAPAFVKAGPPRHPGSQDASQSEESSNSPPLSPPPPGRQRLPRARSSSRGLRPADDDAKRPERAQRFGKRDFNLPIDVNAEGFEGGEVISPTGELSPGIRLGVPKGDSVSGHGVGSEKRYAKRTGSSEQPRSRGNQREDHS